MPTSLLQKTSKSEPKRFKRKVLLLGDGAVGKTSLIRKFVLDKFDDKYIATIGTKVTKKEVGLMKEGQKVFITLMIWDVLGQKGYRSVQSSSFKGADGVILVCDFTRKGTLRSLEDYWLKNLGDNLSKIKFVFVANKCDLINQAQFTLDELQNLASKYNTVAYASSAKTGEKVEELFLSLGKNLLDITDKVPAPELESLEIQSEVTNVVSAADWIINDFCNGFGGIEDAMPIVRQQFNNAGVDIREPTKEGLLKVINLLADVEQGFKDMSVVRENQTRRRLMLEKVS